MLAPSNVPNSSIAVPNSSVAERAGEAPQSRPPGQQAPEWQRRVGDRGRPQLEEAGPGLRPGRGQQVGVDRGGKGEGQRAEKEGTGGGGGKRRIQGQALGRAEGRGKSEWNLGQLQQVSPRPEWVGRLEGRCWRRRKRRWNRGREGHHLELKGPRDGEEGEGAKKENDREEGLWLLDNVGASFCMGM